MDTHTHPHQKICVDSMKLLGDFWTLSIIEALRDGTLRYCDLQRAVGGINPVTLGNRLHKLGDAKLVQRNPSSHDNSVSYQLTDLGRAALPVLDAVRSFSNAHES